ncbi:hypothetical protein HZB01_04255 [Candidatus Woesearchaeota archaeon]|nr:hypothetical protein [Candidatus Woesearchaeota archaeon]
MEKAYGRKSNTYFNLTSRALSGLKKKELVEILNPKEKTGRLYKKTSLGKKLDRELKEFL